MKVRIEFESWNGTYVVSRIDKVVYPGGEYETALQVDSFPTEDLAREFAKKYTSGTKLIATYVDGHEVK